MFRTKWIIRITALSFWACVHLRIILVPDFLGDILCAAILIALAVNAEKSTLAQDCIAPERKWYIARILFRSLLNLLSFVLFHNVFFKGLHVCLNFYPRISTKDWREAFNAIAEAIGLGSAVIMAIIGVLDKREFGISLAQLVEFRYRGYSVFIISHFIIIIGAIFFSYASYFEVAFVCLLCLLFISAVLAKIFSFLILETSNRRKVSLEYFHERIKKNAQADSYINLLISCLDLSQEPNISEIIKEIVYGFSKISSVYCVEEILPNEDIPSLTFKTIKISSATEKMIERLTGFWSVLNNSKSPADRSSIIEEFDKAFANGSINSLQQIIIVLSYVKSLIHSYVQSGQNFGQAIASVQKDLFYSVSEEDIRCSHFRNIAKLATCLTFWMYVFMDRPSCDFNIFRNIALHTKSNLMVHQYKHIFFSFIFLVFYNQPWDQLSENDQRCFIKDCSTAWGQVVESAQSELVRA